MTASPISPSPAVGPPPDPTAGGRSFLVSPVIDYEPAPIGDRCPQPTVLRRRPARPSQPVRPAAVDASPPRAAVVFADAALRRVLEVVDRRRPAAQLRNLLAPTLIDTVIAMTRSPHAAAATLRRVRLRTVDGEAAEVFGTYTRGPRVRAIAARIALDGQRWRIVALHIG